MEICRQILEEHFSDCTLKSILPINGGDINQAFVAHFKGDTPSVFIKVNDSSPSKFFESEFRNQFLLYESLGPQHVPTPRFYKDRDRERQGIAYLVMDYIEPSPCQGNGKKLALLLQKLHSVKNDLFGLGYDNFIGSSDQKNCFSESWSDFFLEQRIVSQASWARKRSLIGTEDEALIMKLLSKLDHFLSPLEGKFSPALCHGDLWSGNAYFSHSGEYVLIDSACYYGFYEVDLAMTQLFGGFPDDFIQEYDRLVGLAAGYQERFKLWNLYHLLNHLNLFGRGYYSSIMGHVAFLLNGA